MTGSYRHAVAVDILHDAAREWSRAASTSVVDGSPEQATIKRGVEMIRESIEVLLADDRARAEPA